MVDKIEMDRVVAHTKGITCIACDIVVSRYSVCGHGESSEDGDNGELHFDLG
jgi:hypothetical protein